ncbi:MAG: HEPN domain-containing protein [Parafilimonas terrae]|nr:HEPN domain-containing protein [Parafilimonas terrae]
MLLDDRLAHLPSLKRRDLARAVHILFEQFEAARTGKLSEWRKRGRILKMILFGSHARGGWVEDRGTGYFSDYDLLVVVNDERWVEDFDLWEAARDRFLQHEIDKAYSIASVSLIVHSYADVNDQLSRGRPFFVDIARDGIVLYEAEGFPLARPGPFTQDERAAEARANFEVWFAGAERSLITAQEQGVKGLTDPGWRKSAAFSLHQASEALYHCFLLTVTLYSPKLHDLRKLRPIAEGIDPRLAAAWPRTTRFSRRCFARLRDAYVNARYSPHYAITAEELAWLTERIEHLSRLVREICAERLGDPHGGANAG